MSRSQGDQCVRVPPADRVTSPVDGQAMDGVSSIHIHNSTDYAGQQLSIRWTQVFFIDDGRGGDARDSDGRDSEDGDASEGRGQEGRGREGRGGGRRGCAGGGEPVDLSRLAETLAHACCLALTPHLDALDSAAVRQLGLRVTINSDTVSDSVPHGPRPAARCGPQRLMFSACIVCVAFTGHLRLCLRLRHCRCL